MVAHPGMQGVQASEPKIPRKGDLLVVRRVTPLALSLGLAVALGMVRTDRLVAQEVKKETTKAEAAKPEAPKAEAPKKEEAKGEAAKKEAEKAAEAPPPTVPKEVE